MSFISFTIPAEPVAFGRSGDNGAVRFTPKRQRDFMALVKLAAHKAMDGEPPLDGPIDLKIRATYLIPMSWSKKRAATARWRTARPDVDNIAKIISDAMNEIVYADDAQVVSLTVQKVYGVVAGVTVTAMCMDENGGGDE